MKPGAPFGLFDSPDIAVRPAKPISAATKPAVPSAGFFPINENNHNPSFELWTFQTAFHQLEPQLPPYRSVDTYL